MTKRMRSILLCFSFFVAYGGGLSLSWSQEPESSPPEKIPYDTPVIKYGDNEYTIGYLIHYSRDTLQGILKAPNEEKRAILDQAVKTMIFDHELCKEAVENGIKDELEYQVNSRLMENNYLHDFYAYHQFIQKYQPDVEELKEVYEQRKEEYFVPPTFTFRHVFFQTIDMPEDVKKKAREDAEAALASIKSGSSFEEVQEIYATDGRKPSVVGPFSPRKYVPEKAINETLEKALLDMKEGEISEIVETKYGYEILKLETLKPETHKPFEQVGGQIFNEMRNKKRAEWIEEIRSAHWEDAVKDYNPDALFDADAPGESVIAQVYGEPFTKAEFLVYRDLEKLKKPGEDDEAFKKRVIDELENGVLFKMITAKLARDLNYEEIPYFIYATNAYRTQNVSKLWWQRLLEQFEENHPITEEDLENYLKENPQFFKRPDRVHAGEMSFIIPPHDESVKYEVFKAMSEAQEKAQAALQRLQAGEEFAEVAKDVSESDSAEQGGDLGIISQESENELHRTLSRNVLLLEKGTFSKEPLKLGNRYHLLINYGVQDREFYDLNEPVARDRATRGLKNRRSQELREKKMQELVKEDEIEYLWKNLVNINWQNIQEIPIVLPEE